MNTCFSVNNINILMANYSVGLHVQTTMKVFNFFKLRIIVSDPLVEQSD